MGVSRIDFGGKTLVDLTEDSVAPNNLLKGYTAHGSDGELVKGAVIIPSVLNEVELVASIYSNGYLSYTATKDCTVFCFLSHNAHINRTDGIIIFSNAISVYGGYTSTSVFVNLLSGQEIVVSSNTVSQIYALKY